MNLRLVFLAAFCLVVPWLVSAQQPADRPIETDVQESTGVSLLLIDVFVTDPEGNPMPGLGKGDFIVQLNGVRRELYSVDDLCPGAIADQVASTTSDAPRDAVGADTTERATHEPPRFVLYFDFAQLRQDGRVRAVEEAKRWIRDVMQPGDEVQLAAFGFDVGREVLTDFTSDKAELIEAIDEAYEAPRFIDPFPSLIESRLGDCCATCGEARTSARCCRACCPTGGIRCAGYAREEYIRSRASLRSLRDFLERLDGTPGRKALLLFHQNTIYQPEKIYSIDQGTVDHIRLLDEVAVEATLSRTTLFPMYTGDRLQIGFPWVEDHAVNTSANFADFTGGSYNRGTTDLSATVDRAGRAPACLYRLGIEPPPGSSPTDIFRVKVSVGDRPLPFRYRAKVLDETAKWERQARRVLDDPDSASEIAVLAAIVPSRASLGRWEVKVQVAVDAGALLQLPTSQGRSGSWEVGVLLFNTESGSSWEMLAVSELSGAEAAGTAANVLHEGTIRDVRPGQYELRAFVRDAVSNVYGGATAGIELPRPFKPELAGPLMMRADVTYFPTDLPRLKKKATQEAKPSRPQEGSIPFGERPVRVGEPVEFLTWVCKLDRKRPVSDVQRFVSRDGKPLFRFDAPTAERVGDCTAIADRLDTTPMEPGPYTYHVEWEREEKQPKVKVKLEFVVAGAPTPE